MSASSYVIRTTLLSAALIGQATAARASEQDCTAQYTGTNLTVPCIQVPGLEGTFSAVLDVTSQTPSIQLSLATIDTPWQEVDVSSLNGIFAKQGYGQVYELNQAQATYNLYDVNSYACILVEEALPIASLQSQMPSVLLKADGSSIETLPKYLSDDTHAYTLKRLDALPSQCAGVTTTVNADYSANLRSLWQTFQDDYPFFVRKNIDWKAIYTQAQAKVGSVTSDVGLLTLFSEMLTPLDDIHVDVYNDTAAIYSHQEVSNWIRRVLNTYRTSQGLNTLEEAFAAQTATTNFTAFVSSLLTDAGHAAYLNNIYTKGDLLMWQYAANLNCVVDAICAGDINSDVAYLNITAMTGYAESADGSSTADLAFVQSFLNEFIADSSAQKAMIIDVRNNEGGNDSVSLAIAQYFADQTRVVINKKTKYVDGFTNQRSISVSPASVTFTKPVYLLINEETFSAGEVFTMIMKQFPHVTLIGETTQGNLSDYIERRLPNHWYFSVPSEVYSDALGNEYEGLGIAPDIEVQYWLPEDVLNDKDAAIERALTEISGS